MSLSNRRGALVFNVFIINRLRGGVIHKQLQTKFCLDVRYLNPWIIGILTSAHLSIKRTVSEMRTAGSNPHLVPKHL